MDVWRRDNKLCFWLKTLDGDVVVSRSYTAYVYVRDCVSGRSALRSLGLAYDVVPRSTYEKELSLLRVRIPRLDQYENIVRSVERATRHRVGLFDADIPPEQRYLYENDLYPGCGVDVDTFTRLEDDPPVLSQTVIRVTRREGVVARIAVDDDVLVGDERDVLERFLRLFKEKDPDVVLAHKAFSALAFLDERLRTQGLISPFHRFSTAPLVFRGGRSFHSYGRTMYREFGVRLRGRFLVSLDTPIGRSCSPDAVLELCGLSGWLFQQLASRSHGAVFQGSLLRELVRDNKVVAYKEKPLPTPMSMYDLVKSDRAGHTLDAKTGFHTDVAEVDFASMFPHLMIRHNISAEKVGVGAKAPGVPVRIDEREEGYVPRALKPFLERRMYYKAHPSRVNRRRSAGLKGVLVSANGYLRFREFKLGLPATHVALCAYARELLLSVVHLAEERGFRVVHGIVDSVYLQKNGISEEEVRSFCQEVSEKHGIPLSFEGVFRWMVFLPSVQDSSRPVPTRFYGAYKTGGFKVRGVEARQRKPPLVVRRFQEAVLAVLSGARTQQEFFVRLPSVFRAARRVISLLDELPSDLLAYTVDLSKTEYKHDIPQRRVVAALRAQGQEIFPGQTIQYVFLAGRGAVLASHARGRVDTALYREEFVRALYSLLCGVGVGRDEVRAGLLRGVQQTLYSFVKPDVDAGIVRQVVSQVCRAP